MGDYTAMDILECCGLNPAGAPRTVVLAATALELSLRHGAPKLLVSVPPGYGQRRRGVCYPPEHYSKPCPRVHLWEGAVQWARAMAKELDLDAHPLFGGGGARAPKDTIAYATGLFGEWRPIDIPMSAPERAAGWWRDCTYPLGPRRA